MLISGGMLSSLAPRLEIAPAIKRQERLKQLSSQVTGFVGFTLSLVFFPAPVWNVDSVPGALNRTEKRNRCV